MNNKRMRNSVFMLIVSPIVVVLLAVTIIATTILNSLAPQIDVLLGKGEMHTVGAENTEDWDLSYYENPYGTGDEALASAQKDALKAAREIAQNGIVLLKNDNNALPIKKNSSVTPFGYEYTSPMRSGSRSSTGRVTPAEALAEAFKVNETVEAVLSDESNRVTMDGTGYTDGGSTSSSKIAEIRPEAYSGTEASCKGTTGIIFFARSGGESQDVALPGVPGSPITQNSYFDGTRHYLQMTQYEREAVRFAKANCEKTVAIINADNILEIGDLMKGELAVDAVLWIGGPGAVGFQAMTDILCGDVNPSGKTIEIWANDFMSDPVTANFGSFKYTDLDVVPGISFAFGPVKQTRFRQYAIFNEYEEGVYMGYRYYETMHDTGATFSVRGENNKKYDDAVVAPFGYGLSYTNFKQEIISMNTNDGEVTMTVKVSNVGDVAGKDAVQIYYNPPYTQFDYNNKIAKATKNLIAFDKTGLIEPGESETVTLNFALEDMASYSYTHVNSDGTKGAYMLEAGQYEIILGKDSHNEYATETVSVYNTTWYGSNNPRQSEKDAQSYLNDDGTLADFPAKREYDSDAQYVAATNRFQSSTDYVEKEMDLIIRPVNGALQNRVTAPDFAGKKAPSYLGVKEAGPLPENQERVMQRMDVNTDTYLGNVEGSKVYVPDSEMPVTGKDNGLTLSSFRGVNYWDPRWDDLVDQIDLSSPDLYESLCEAGFHTYAIESVGKPMTTENDSTQGLSGTGITWPTPGVIAATFDRDMGRLQGEMQAKVNNARGENRTTGWYAPGLNLHRSPFSGRSGEYYSEDAVLTGVIAANVVSGATEYGLPTYMKHFALNDIEEYDNRRSVSFIWADEQTMRELYFKAFEIAIKNSYAEIKYVSDSSGTISTKVIRAATGLMTSMNYIGSVFAGAHYELATELVRGEWGFQGTIITDMCMNGGPQNPDGTWPSNSIDQCLRSGNDLFMTMMPQGGLDALDDHTSATAVTAIKKAVKNVCYTAVNSNAMIGLAPGATVYYDMSPWMVWLIVANVFVYAVCLFLVVMTVLRTIDSKKHHENYKGEPLE